MLRTKRCVHGGAAFHLEKEMSAARWKIFAAGGSGSVRRKIILLLLAWLCGGLMLKAAPIRDSGFYCARQN